MIEQDGVRFISWSHRRYPPRTSHSRAASESDSVQFDAPPVMEAYWHRNRPGGTVRPVADNQ